MKYTWAITLNGKLQVETIRRGRNRCIEHFLIEMHGNGLEYHSPKWSDAKRRGFDCERVLVRKYQ